MNVIGLIGLPGSGKGEAVKVAEELGIPIVLMGDLVREKVKSEGLEVKASNAAKIATSERNRFGADIWARRIIKVVNELNINEPRPAIGGKIDSVILIDGIRSEVELNAFESHWRSNFKLIAVTASHEIRAQRVLARKRKDDAVTKSDFIEREERELSYGIEKAMSSADHYIENEGTVEEFRGKVKKLFDKILFGK